MHGTSRLDARRDQLLFPDWCGKWVSRGGKRWKDGRMVGWKGWKGIEEWLASGSGAVECRAGVVPVWCRCNVVLLLLLLGVVGAVLWWCLVWWERWVMWVR